MMKRSVNSISISIALALFALACGGDSDGGGYCGQAMSKLRGCGLLSEGYRYCEEPTAEERCEANCVVNADCSALNEYICGGGEESAIEACFDRCGGGGGSFTCANGTVIEADWQCDAFDDCGDNSDEVGCVLYTCANGTTLPVDWECDGQNDCGDGSDEQGCPASAVFTCGNGEQVPASWECDGASDCEDGSDEHGCATFTCGAGL